MDLNDPACSRALSKAELYLCLARAFAIPDRAAAWEALRDALPTDLEDLAVAGDYPLQWAGAALRLALTRVADRERLLVIYSRLFLVPGVAHPNLNAGVYLDGMIGGGTCMALEGCYRQCGLRPDDDFHDLPDHVSSQLEFLAWLLAREAETGASGGSPPAVTAAEVLRRFIGPWVSPFRQDLERASERFDLPDNPYLTLARVLETAVAADLSRAPAGYPAPPVAPEIARRRAELAGRPLMAADLAWIRERLAAAGLPYGHVAIPVEERDRIMGLSTMIPPTAPSHRVAFTP